MVTTGIDDMVRVKQWLSGDQLSYMLIEPVSRHCAMIDPQPGQEAEYLQVIRMRGLNCRYVLFTAETGYDSGLAAEQVAAATELSQSTLPLGETHIERFVHSSSRLALYVCDGHLLSGQWLTPFALRQNVAGDVSRDSSMMPLVNFPDDHIVHPGKMVAGIRISTIAQEKMAAVSSRGDEGVSHA
jgi:hypothetical protein